MSATNDFANYTPGLESPPANAVAVTPSNSTDLTNEARALWIGVTGDVCVNMSASGSGAAIVFKAVPVGYLVGRFARVKATGTTATDIVAVW